MGAFHTKESGEYFSGYRRCRTFAAGPETRVTFQTRAEAARRELAYTLIDSRGCKRNISMANEAMLAFFSYSRHDSEFALKLAKDLRQHGAAVWLDQLDINPGERWDSTVEQ